LAIAPQGSPQLLLVDAERKAITARFEGHEAPVCLLASQGEWLASADSEGNAHIFSLDSLQHHARVPVGRAKGKPTALCFDPGRHRLIIALSTRSLLIYDVEGQALATDVPSFVRIPKTITPAHSRVCGLVVPPGSRDKLLLWGHNFLAKVDLSKVSADTADNGPVKKRRKSGGGAAEVGGEADGGWASYDGFEHIVALCGLEESQWGAPLLPDKGVAAGSSKKRRGSGASASGSSKRAMVLTMEVAPAAIKRSLPQPFERKEHHGA